jgi:hypothetical protein
MAGNSGIIYDLGGGRFGLALHREQQDAFKKSNRVYLHVFTDKECSQPELDPVTGKKYVTLKHLSKIKPIGFSD